MKTIEKNMVIYFIFSFNLCTKGLIIIIIIHNENYYYHDHSTRTFLDLFICTIVFIYRKRVLKRRGWLRDSLTIPKSPKPRGILS